MVEQIGIVIQTEPDGWASVQTDRKSACGGCHSGPGGGCHGCLAGGKFIGRVSNPVGAKPGDVVKIAMRSEDLFKGAVMLYLLPIVTLLIGAFTGNWAAGLIGWPQVAGSILGAFAGVGIAVFLLIRIDRSNWTRKRLTPAVLGVLSSEKPAAHSADVGHACCG
ncbi:MAG: SoxR reducing system RseC family protein [Desulfosarcinaceae bacterium]|jgi:sigma-E factor negative regulatory protein RseC